MLVVTALAGPAIAEEQAGSTLLWADAAKSVAEVGQAAAEFRDVAGLSPLRLGRINLGSVGPAKGRAELGFTLYELAERAYGITKAWDEDKRAGRDPLRPSSNTAIATADLFRSGLKIAKDAPVIAQHLSAPVSALLDIKLYFEEDILKLATNTDPWTPDHVAQALDLLNKTVWYALGFSRAAAVTLVRDPNKALAVGAKAGEAAGDLADSVAKLARQYRWTGELAQTSYDMWNNTGGKLAAIYVTTERAAQAHGFALIPIGRFYDAAVLRHMTRQQITQANATFGFPANMGTSPVGRAAVGGRLTYNLAVPTVVLTPPSTGPSCTDCKGVVVAPAIRKAGSIPDTTSNGILSLPRLGPK